MIVPRNWKHSAGMLSTIASGAGAGLALGAMVGPHGVALGLVIGTTLGFVAGRIMDTEERKRSDRTRELDAVIGITEGSLGAGPVSLEPGSEAAEDAEAAEEKRRWLAEWLTPPPPQVG